ncbi:MAG: hypothetical protein H7Y36_10385, partial [Armatimonadetes bacterium]|nr:hypothetical protein [Akkermansiaceae bacterium]
MAEIAAAKAAISEMDGSGYQGLLSVIDKWPRLGVLSDYEDKVAAGEVKKILEAVYIDLSYMLREFVFVGDEKATPDKLDELSKLYIQLGNKGGYTNNLISSAIRVTLRAGIFSTINNKKIDISETKKLLDSLNKGNGNFNFREWLLDATTYDMWAKEHTDYINAMPQFPSILEVTFPLIKLGEKIPNRISHVKMLDEVSSLQLGINLYESEFLEHCVIPFWISYVESEGLPEINSVEMNIPVSNAIIS